MLKKNYFHYKYILLISGNKWIPWKSMLMNFRNIIHCIFSNQIIIIMNSLINKFNKITDKINYIYIFNNLY